MAKPKTKAPNAIDVHVGSRVRMRRTMLGMTQQTLAEAFGQANVALLQHILNFLTEPH